MDVAKFSASFCHQSVDHPVCKSLVGTYNRVCNSKYEPTSMNDFMRSVKHLIQVLIVCVYCVDRSRKFADSDVMKKLHFRSNCGL